MQPLLEVIADALKDWDQARGAEPILTAARVLVKDGRFDELTLALIAFSQHFASKPEVMRHVRTRIGPVVLSHYIYTQAGVSGKTIDQHFGDMGMGDTIARAAFREGQLKHAVMSVVEQLHELDKQPAA